MEYPPATTERVVWQKEARLYQVRPNIHAPKDFDAAKSDLAVVACSQAEVSPSIVCQPEPQLQLYELLADPSLSVGVLYCTGSTPGSSEV